MCPMWATPFLSYLLSADLFLALSMLIRMWVLVLIHAIYHLLTLSILLLSVDLSLTLSACQDVSCPSFILFTACWPLTCSVVTLPACECCLLFILLLTSHSLCLYLLGCECCPLFVLFAICQPLFCSVSSSRMWVPFINPAFLSANLSLLVSLWVVSLIYHIYCLITILLPGLCLLVCECHPKFIYIYYLLISLSPKFVFCLCL